MKTKTFVVGELCRIKGSKETYRYVKNNSVRSVTSGRIYSVKSGNILKTHSNYFAENLDKMWIMFKIIFIALVLCFAMYIFY